MFDLIAVLGAASVTTLLFLKVLSWFAPLTTLVFVGWGTCLAMKRGLMEGLSSIVGIGFYAVAWFNTTTRVDAAIIASMGVALWSLPLMVMAHDGTMCRWLHRHGIASTC